MHSEAKRKISEQGLEWPVGEHQTFQHTNNRSPGASWGRDESASESNLFLEMPKLMTRIFPKLTKTVTLHTQKTQQTLSRRP